MSSIWLIRVSIQVGRSIWSVFCQGFVSSRYNRRRWGSDAWVKGLRQSGEKDGATFRNWKWELTRFIDRRYWPNSFNAHRLMLYAFSIGFPKMEELTGRLFSATYEEGENISSIECLSRISKELGLEGVEEMLRTDAMKREVIEQDDFAKDDMEIKWVLGKPPYPVEESRSLSSTIDTIWRELTLLRLLLVCFECWTEMVTTLPAMLSYPFCTSLLFGTSLNVVITCSHFLFVAYQPIQGAFSSRPSKPPFANNWSVEWKVREQWLSVALGNQRLTTPRPSPFPLLSSLFHISFHLLFWCLLLERLLLL